MFSPPLDSDELHNALKMRYPLFKTHRGRLAQAIIDFCMREQTSGPDTPDMRFTTTTTSNEHLRTLLTSPEKQLETSSEHFSLDVDLKKKPLPSPHIPNYVDVCPARLGRRRKALASSDLKNSDYRIMKPRAEVCAEHANKKRRASVEHTHENAKLC